MSNDEAGLAARPRTRGRKEISRQRKEKKIETKRVRKNK